MKTITETASPSTRRDTLQSVTLKIDRAHARPYNIAMFQKKIFALACACAIVAIGACFLPPRPAPQLPAPPLPHRDLEGIHTIHVVVDDQVRSLDFNSSFAADIICEGINRRSRNSGVKALPPSDNKHEDAILKIRLMNENDPLDPSVRSQRVGDSTLVFTYSATLAKPDGHILWQENHSVQRSSSTYSMLEDLGADLALRMFYGK